MIKEHYSSQTTHALRFVPLTTTLYVVLTGKRIVTSVPWKMLPAVTPASLRSSVVHVVSFWYLFGKGKDSYYWMSL